MVNQEEIKQLVENRLAQLLVRIKQKEEDVRSPLLKHHAEGYLEAVVGTFGEQKFLEDLLNRLQ